MLVEHLPHFGQAPACVGGITIGAGRRNQSKLALHPLDLARGEFRAVGCEYAHLPSLVRVQRGRRFVDACGVGRTVGARREQRAPLPAVLTNCCA